jgi:hypothetical protein
MILRLVIINVIYEYIFISYLTQDRCIIKYHTNECENNDA